MESGVLMSELDARLRDEIDDQVAEAFDAYLAERLTEPGPLRTALNRRPLFVLMTLLAGVLATWLAPNVLVACVAWAVVALVNVLT